MVSEQNVEKAQRLLALFLHDEFCSNPAGCGGAKDYMDAAEHLLPRIAEFIFPPEQPTHD